jgi:hypothetical protein
MRKCFICGKRLRFRYNEASCDHLGCKIFYTKTDGTMNNIDLDNDSLINIIHNNKSYLIDNKNLKNPLAISDRRTILLAN